jgi:hypothetical protein
MPLWVSWASGVIGFMVMLPGGWHLARDASARFAFFETRDSIDRGELWDYFLTEVEWRESRIVQAEKAATKESPGRKSRVSVEMKRTSRRDGTLQSRRESASRYNQPFVRAIRAASTRFAAPIFEIASDK